MAGIVKEILARPIQLADQVTKNADYAQSFKQECIELKTKTEKLAALLRQAARASNDLYERPTRRIIDDTEQLLDKALILVLKCRANGILRRMFTIIPAAAFKKTSTQLENSIGDVSWLLRVSAPAEDRDEHLGLPPIASNEPILGLIWEQVAILHTGTLDERSDAAASLASLARDNDRYGKLIIEEGGVAPLLKLAKEGRMESQENAVRAIGLLGRDSESVEQIVNCGVCSVFAKILKDGHMAVQSVVAWAVSEMATYHPKCQDHFAQNNVIRLLVSHLAFETIQEHSRYTIVATKQQMSIHSVLMANNKNSDMKNGYELEEEKQRGSSSGSSCMNHPNGNGNGNGNGNSLSSGQIHNVVSDTMAMKNPNSSQTVGRAHGQQAALSGASIKGREYEDPVTKAQMKAMAAKALWHLCKGNVTICRNITESRALLCFAVLLEKGPEDVKYYSVMALMEITAVAEQNAELRRSGFKPTSPAAKAVVEQLLKIVEKANCDLLIPSIIAIGHLARTFRATETRMIGPLVKLFDEKEAEVEVLVEVVIALDKFACPDNFLHDNHCKAIIEAGGTKHLVQLAYFGEQMVKIPSLILLCHIVLHVPDSEVLAQDEVLNVLEISLKNASLIEEPNLQTLLSEAKSRLELYQSRGSRGKYVQTTY